MYIRTQTKKTICNLDRFDGIEKTDTSDSNWEILAINYGASNGLWLGTYPTEEAADHVMGLLLSTAMGKCPVFEMPAEDSVWISDAIGRTITMGCAHIRESTDKWLENAPVCAYPKVDQELESHYGWYVHVLQFEDDPELLKRIPDDLRACIQLALDNGCTLLELDCDAPELPGLPVYEWEN